MAAAAARQRVPFRAEAGGAKVAGRRGAAPGRSTRATASRGPASTDRPWTTSVSAGGGRRSGQGPAAASGLWGFRSHPGARLGCASLSSLRLLRTLMPHWVQGPVRSATGAGASLPGQTSSSSAGPSLRFPTPTSARLPPGLGFGGCSLSVWLTSVPSRPPPTLHTPLSPGVRDRAPFESPPVSHHKLQERLGGPHPHSNDKCPRLLHRHPPTTTTTASNLVTPC